MACGHGLAKKQSVDNWFSSRRFFLGQANRAFAVIAADQRALRRSRRSIRAGSLDAVSAQVVTSVIATELMPEKLSRASNALQRLRWGRVHVDSILQGISGGTHRCTHAVARRKLGRPEAKDGDLLLQIEQRRRTQGCSQRKAIIEVLDELPWLGVDRQGGSTVSPPYSYRLSGMAGVARISQ
jgi:hypothetical protein